MSTLIWLIFWLLSLIFIAYHRLSLIAATIAIGVCLIITTFFSQLTWVSLILLWGVYGGLAFFFNHPELRRRYITFALFDKMSKNLPHLSETEKTALDAGTVGWEGELFSGNPQWEKLLTIPKPKLSEEEQAFIDGPVKTLCEMLNDWEVAHESLNLPEKIWDYLKSEGFFALVLPKKYGGKGFSEFAHSEILTILAGRSLTLSSTVAVPNSLGPAELLLRYGTQSQRDHYLPLLAKGKEIPCFALTGPEAGSDASAITDTGIICKGEFEGKEIVGIRLNWNKRYITLAPVATLLGLAFKLYDPEHLLGNKKALGITCALIPTHTPGVIIGRRHLPSGLPFQNGPTQGNHVFIPLDWIIGGPKMAGQGWKMLVECLSTGRAISLPSSCAGGARVAALASGAYSRIRRQFRTSLSSFEGIQEALGRIGGLTYMSEAIRCLTVSMIDAGEKPSVPGAISKYHVTEFGRKVAIDAMDIHGGKGIMMGPKNYLAIGYQGTPIAITVEGANILTRSMIIFGQGAIRCHPYLLKEMQAISHQNFNDFEYEIGEHLSYTLSNASRAFFHALTGAKLASSPVNNETKSYFQQLAHTSSAFSFIADITLALLGSKLKFKESISGRLGDLLSMMYIMSAVLKRYQDQGSLKADLPLVRWSLDYCIANFWHTMDQIIRNLPYRAIRIGLRFILMPLGVRHTYPSDSLNQQVTEILTQPGEARARLIGNSFISKQEEDPITLLERALQETIKHDVLLKRVMEAVKNKDLTQGSLKQAIEAAFSAKIITESEADELYTVEKICSLVIAVDDFSAEELNRKPTLNESSKKSKKTQPDFSPDKIKHSGETDHPFMN